MARDSHEHLGAKVKADPGRHCVAARTVTSGAPGLGLPVVEGVERGGPQRGLSEGSEQAQGHGTRMSPFCDTGPPVPLATPSTAGAARRSLHSRL